MSISYKQSSTFLADVVGDDLLQKVIDWVADNLDPEDVFSDKQLETRALNSGFVEEE